MPIPDYQKIMYPLLKLSSDGNEYSSKESVDRLSKIFNLKEEEKEEKYDTKNVTIFYDRVHWALSYLKNAGLMESTKRGFFKITSMGKDVLKQDITDIDKNYLKQFPEFNEFLNRSKINNDTHPNLESSHTSIKTPQESIEENYQMIRENLINELLSNVRKSSPKFFEKLVVDLLVTMGYGGSMKEAGQAIGKTGDEGIDGIIKEDILGLDAIYIQAKKWEGVLGRPEIHKFVGALQGQRAKKGVFITTSKFSKESIDYVSKIEQKVVLVDGNQLGEYMLDHNIGVTTEKFYELKKMNFDYFEEFN